jgi:hypothetical protein
MRAISKSGSAILFAGLAEVKLVYAKNAKWLLSGPHQLQKFAQ